MKVDLTRLFAEWNLRAFDGILPIPEIRWNSRLQTTAGRFIPNRKNPVIEIAQYLQSEENGAALIRDTVGHEMIHYWLWIKKQPYGHNAAFYEKMEAIGVSRYNPVPRHRPFKHCYVCVHCELKIWVRKRIGRAACASCCNQHTQGKYSVKYELRIDGNAITPVVDLPRRA